HSSTRSVTRSPQRRLICTTRDISLEYKLCNRKTFESFPGPSVALEQFKEDTVHWRTENSAKNWATAYDFPAVKEKRVILEEFPQRSRGIMQAFAFNTRRDKFKDPRVRRAFNFAYDFEEMNKQIFFGQYTRIKSYFEGTELAC